MSFIITLLPEPLRPRKRHAFPGRKGGTGTPNHMGQMAIDAKGFPDIIETDHPVTADL